MEYFRFLISIFLICAVTACGSVNQESKKSLTSESDPKISMTTAGRVPRWNGTSMIDGSIYDANGKIGIGTTNPTSPIHASMSTTNETASINVLAEQNPIITTNGTYYGYALVGVNKPLINTGISNTGLVAGGSFSGIRDNPDDAGSLTGVYGALMSYGHNVSGSKTTTNAIGIQIIPYHTGGTITNSIGLYISSPIVTSTAVVGNYMGIYQSASQAKNVFLGNTGIGNDPGATTFYVNGTTWSTTAWSSSDERLKKNIVTIDSPLDKIEALRGVYYNWRIKEYPNIRFPAERQMGLIAQDAERVVPESVHANGDGFKGINYSSITSLLVEGIKAQNIEIKYLKSLLEDEQKQRRELANKIERLEKLIKSGH